MPKLPWHKWYPQDWLSEPGLAMCEPSTRGIWADAVNVMLLQGKSSISGTDEQLSRLLRCKIDQIQAAVFDLKSHTVAKITMHNGCTTIESRRLVRELKYKSLKAKAAHARWCKHYADHIQNDDAQVDARSASASASSAPTSGNRGLGEGGFCETPSWEEFWAYCQNSACLLPAEWYARDKWEAANQSNWAYKTNWMAYARRCKGWWEADGRPMTPPASRNSANGKPLSPLDYKTIIQAKQTQADAIKNKFCSETACDRVWADESKRQEYATLRKEIKDLTAKLGAYGT